MGSLMQPDAAVSRSADATPCRIARLAPAGSDMANNATWIHVSALMHAQHPISPVLYFWLDWFMWVSLLVNPLSRKFQPETPTINFGKGVGLETKQLAAQQGGHYNWQCLIPHYRWC